MRILNILILSSFLGFSMDQIARATDGMDETPKFSNTKEGWQAGVKFLKEMPDKDYFIMAECKRAKCKVYIQNNNKKIKALFIPYNKYLADMGPSVYQVQGYNNYVADLAKGKPVSLDIINKMNQDGMNAFLEWKNTQPMAKPAMRMSKMGMSKMQSHHDSYKMKMPMDKKKRRMMRVKNEIKKAKLEGLLSEALKELQGMDYIPMGYRMRHMMMKKHMGNHHRMGHGSQEMSSHMRAKSSRGMGYDHMNSQMSPSMRGEQDYGMKSAASSINATQGSSLNEEE